MEKAGCLLPGFSRPGLQQPLLQVRSQETCLFGLPCRCPWAPWAGTEALVWQASLRTSADLVSCLSLSLPHLYWWARCPGFMVDLFSTSLMDDVELMWFPSTGERLWLKEASHHKCKSETSLCLEPLPFDSTPSALFVTLCRHNIIEMLLSCERKALSQRKPEMVGFELSWMSVEISAEGEEKEVLGLYPRDWLNVSWRLCRPEDIQ